MRIYGPMEEPPYVRMMQSGSRLGPFEVFVSYAHVDESMRRALEAHLSPLARTWRIALWHDRRIGAGHDWAAEIDERIESADIILLLVSPYFVASEYCYGIEMTRAVERHRAGAATVIPGILGPCQWDELPFAEIQALPTDARPITLWDNEDEAYLDVVNGLRNSLERLPPPEIEKRSERLSPSSLVALRTNLLLRPGRLRPGNVPTRGSRSRLPVRVVPCEWRLGWHPSRASRACCGHVGRQGACP